MKKIILIISYLFIFIVFSFSQITDQVYFSQDELTFHTINDYDFILIKYGFDNNHEQGNPQLPYVKFRYVLPLNVEVTDVIINSSSKEQIIGTFSIYPKQPEIILDGRPTPPFLEPNPQIYNSSNPYPGMIAEIEYNKYLFGYNIVQLNIYPL